MNSKLSDSLVEVYSTSLEFDAGIVKAMLADEGIESTIENTSGPFLGLPAVPCQLFVAADDELRARELIEQHTIRHLQRLEAENQRDLE